MSYSVFIMAQSGFTIDKSGFTIDIRPNGEGIKFCIGSRLAPITKAHGDRLLCGMRPKGGHHDRLRPMDGGGLIPGVKEKT